MKKPLISTGTASTMAEMAKCMAKDIKHCEDCLAYYSVKNHVCPPFLKILVAEHKKKKVI